MTTKEMLIEIASQLPEDATLAAYELELRAAILEGTCERFSSERARLPAASKGGKTFKPSAEAKAFARVSNDKNRVPPANLAEATTAVSNVPRWVFHA